MCTTKNDLIANVRFRSIPLVQMGPLVESYTLHLVGSPGQGSHGSSLTGLGMDQDQPKVSVSLSLDFRERMFEKKLWTVSSLSVIRILTFACNA